MAPQKVPMPQMMIFLALTIGKIALYNMKFQDIPTHLGITAKQLADMAGIQKQNLHAYLKGAKGKSSTVVLHVCAVADLNREEVFFPDPFNHPWGGDPGKPAYWLALAIEALKEAQDRGVTVHNLIDELLRVGREGLDDFGPGIFE